MTAFNWILLITLIIFVFWVTPKLMKIYIENEAYKGGIGRLFFLTSFIISFCVSWLFRLNLFICLGLTIALALL